VELLDGSTRMEVVPEDSIGRAIYLYGSYELSVTRFLAGVLRPGDTFVDGGANRGYHALLAAARVGAGGRVHAFEPQDHLRGALERSAAMNGFGNVVAHAEAIAEREGVVEFFDCLLPGNSGLSSVLPGYGRSPVPRRVPATTLDALADAVGAVDVVKLDLEGGEPAALRGARRLLSRPDAPLLVFEAADPFPLVAQLAEQGYEVRAVHFSPRRGLEFPGIGEPFDDLYAGYEAPNFVAGTARARRLPWLGGGT
jgi:FkbM family methyltransferase